MNRRVTAGFAMAATMGLSVPSAHAGPCSAAIAQFEHSVRQSASNPQAGPVGPETVGAQLGHEPTPASIRRAERRAQAAFNAALARAKRLDARGDRAGCAKALARAEGMYDLH